MNSTPEDKSPSKSEKEILLINIVSLAKVLRSSSNVLFKQASLYKRLVQVEWEQEKQRFSKLLATALFGFSCLICFLFFLGFVTLAISWDTHYRLISILCLCGLYGLGAYAAWNRFWRLVDFPDAYFSGARTEIAADIALIRSKLQ